MSTLCVHGPSDHVRPWHHLASPSGSTSLSPQGVGPQSPQTLLSASPHPLFFFQKLALSSFPSSTHLLHLPHSLPRWLAHPIGFPPSSCQNSARGRNKTLLQSPPSPSGLGWATLPGQARRATHGKDICLQPPSQIPCWGGAHGKQESSLSSPLSRWPAQKAVTKFRRCQPWSGLGRGGDLWQGPEPCSTLANLSL